MCAIKQSEILFNRLLCDLINCWNDKLLTQLICDKTGTELNSKLDTSQEGNIVNYLNEELDFLLEVEDTLFTCEHCAIYH